METLWRDMTFAVLVMFIVELRGMLSGTAGLERASESGASGSFTNDGKITALQTASGRRALHK